jgi:hypothetical protein
MLTIARVGTLILAINVGLLCAQLADAQRAQDPAPAPVPAQITAAKKVFISNAGQEINPRAGNLGIYSGGPDRAYNQFYAAVKNWGKYELVPAPADADLVLEMSFHQPIVWGEWVHSGPADDAHFRLVILDPKTRIVLWAFTEHVEWAHLQSNRDKNFDRALQNIVKDLQGLAGRS